MKIQPAVTEEFHAEGRKDGRTDGRTYRDKNIQTWRS